MTAVAGSVFTAAQFNTFVRDNLAEVAPAKATTPGGYFVTSATNQIVERSGKLATQLVSDTTTSTSYSDLDGGTLGPSVSVATSNCAIVVVSGSLHNSSTFSTRMGYEVSGASSVAAADNRALGVYGAANVGIVASQFVYHEDLTAGNNVFTAKYRVAGGTGTFQSRRLTVIPL
jgi:hypothetical protein